MKRIIVAVIILVVLTGCSSTKSFTGIVTSVKEDIITVDCSDEVNKTLNDWGYECSVIITEETLLLNANEESITINDLKDRNEFIKVHVTLSSPTNLMEDEIVAEKVEIKNED